MKRGEKTMIENNKKQVEENDKLLTVMMALLNLSILVSVGVVIWSVNSAAQNSNAITKIINGGFMP
jgi:flagellar basal body-associated protein FliL